MDLSFVAYIQVLKVGLRLRVMPFSLLFSALLDDMGYMMNLILADFRPYLL